VFCKYSNQFVGAEWLQPQSLVLAG